MATLNSNDGKPSQGQQAIDGLAEAFDYANASLTLEGLVVSAEQRARQQQVIDGKLTIEEAVAQSLAVHREGE